MPGYQVVDVGELDAEGPGRMRIDGEEVELRPGRFVRVDPKATRVPISGVDGLELVTVGASLEGRYEPLPGDRRK